MIKLPESHDATSVVKLPMTDQERSAETESPAPKDVQRISGSCSGLRKRNQNGKRNARCSPEVNGKSTYGSDNASVFSLKIFKPPEQGGFLFSGWNEVAEEE